MQVFKGKTATFLCGISRQWKQKLGTNWIRVHLHSVTSNILILLKYDCSVFFFLEDSQSTQKIQSAQRSHANWAHVEVGFFLYSVSAIMNNRRGILSH